MVDNRTHKQFKLDSRSARDQYNKYREVGERNVKTAGAKSDD